MKKSAWKQFAAARGRFRGLVEALDRELPGLREVQQELVDGRSGPEYPVETPVVYNGALDDLGPGADIRLILVGDNPGRREQAGENRRYLVGPSGKIAEGFFRAHPELGIGFREHVIILNKTPIHTPRTGELRELARRGGEDLGHKIAESQRAMAEILLAFHQALAPLAVWITGYSEMKRGGVFEAYTNALGECYRGYPARRGEILLFRHFSMNQFTIDLNRQRGPGEDLGASLERIGGVYRQRILGW